MTGAQSSSTLTRNMLFFHRSFGAATRVCSAVVLAAAFIGPACAEPTGADAMVAPGASVRAVDAEARRGHQRRGDQWRQQGRTADALAEYVRALEIAQRHADEVPDDHGRQRELEISHNDVGEMQRVRRDLQRALMHFKQALNIASRLSMLEPTHAEWQRDLSVSLHKIGDVRRELGHLGGAIQSYQVCMVIARQLAAAQPDNAALQLDLSVSHDRLGDAMLARGDHAGAL